MQRTLGPDHPQTRITMIHLAETYVREGRLDEALPRSEEALKFARSKVGPDHPDTLWATSNLAEAYMAATRLDEGARLYEERVNRSMATLGPDHRDTITSMRTLADSYAAHGRFAGAAGQFRRIFRREPDNHADALRAALLSLAVGDQEIYDADCRQMLDRFASTENGWAANRTSLTCLMSSSPMGDVQHLVRLADLAVAAFNDGSKFVDRVISCRTRGLAAYRAGDYQGALKWCQESRNAGGTEEHFSPLSRNKSGD